MKKCTETDNEQEELKMKVFVTGVAGQLGHDVMNELAKRGYEGVGSDIAPSYSGISDGTAVTTMPYISMDITDAAAVEKTLQRCKAGRRRTLCGVDRRRSRRGR